MNGIEREGDLDELAGGWCGVGGHGGSDPDALSLGGIEGLEVAQRHFQVEESHQGIDLIDHACNRLIQGSEILSTLGFQWVVIEVQDAKRFRGIGLDG